MQSNAIGCPLQKRFYGVVARAVQRSETQCRTDLHQSLSTFLARQVRRAKGRQYVKLCPTIESRTWSREGERHVSARTIQRWVLKLEALGLVEAIRHGTCTVLRFRFRIQHLSAFPKKDRQVSAHTFTGEGEPPTEVPPSVDKSPAGGGAVPHCGSQARPMTDTAPPLLGKSVRDAARAMFENSPAFQAKIRKCSGLKTHKTHGQVDCGQLTCGDGSPSGAARYSSRSAGRAGALVHPDRGQ